MPFSRLRATTFRQDTARRSRRLPIDRVDCGKQLLLSSIQKLDLLKSPNDGQGGDSRRGSATAAPQHDDAGLASVCLGLCKLDDSASCGRAAKAPSQGQNSARDARPGKLACQLLVRLDARPYSVVDLPHLVRRPRSGRGSLLSEAVPRSQKRDTSQPLPSVLRSYCRRHHSPPAPSPRHSHYAC